MISDTIIKISDTLVDKTGLILESARTEEDLRIGFEKLLEPILKGIGIETKPVYEHHGGKTATAYRGRPDAVHGLVIIEYEQPKTFDSPRVVSHAYEQLVNYISAESVSAAINRLVGVGFDGESIFFVKFQNETGGEIKEENFVRQGPYKFDASSARTFLAYLRALSRRPLTAANLAEVFGPKSNIAVKTVSAFADALDNWGSERVGVFLAEWKRLFGIVYGEQFGDQKNKNSVSISLLYKIEKEMDFQEILFSVHTYFALLMKLIAAELLSFKDTAFVSSFSSRLTHCSNSDLKSLLADVETGGMFAKKGVTNFLEGDFFRWYLDAFSPRLEEAIRETARALSEFEPATTIIEPESTRDLLKKLYQYLVPQDVRHNLGEYYTPEWLAELVLDETGYTGDTAKRILDPACGSGTFLVLAIRAAREFGKNHNEPPIETAKRITSNIWGFDLNPLAVIASRTNYLFALGDMALHLSSFEIPVYLADSVLWPERNGQRSLNFIGGEYVNVRTSLPEDFHVPTVWIRDKGFFMSKAAPLIEEMIRNNYSPQEAMERFQGEGLAFPPHENVVRNFYEQIRDLESQGKNGIWARFLKNVFAPIMADKFDFVIGNPPWIRWGYLSEEYRKATLNMWQEYGLFSLKGHAARLGGGEKDFSMLFTYAAADYYLKNNGKLGFLITQEVFKSKGAGEGFRRFQIGDRDPLQILKAHDFVSVQPFEGAANKSAAIILKKGAKTRYPVSYTLWTRKKGAGKIPTEFKLPEARPLLNKKRLEARPIGTPTSSWQTTEKGRESLAFIKGINHYKARLGARTEPYGVFWLEVEQVMHNGDLIVRNMHEKGKRIIRQVEERIESDLVFPAVRGADIERWHYSRKIFILIAQDPVTRIGYLEVKMKTTWPRTYGYLLRFKNELLDRAAYKKYHAETQNPFYSQYNISDYTFARYKVVWKRMAGDITAAIISQHKTPFGFKTVIPTDTTSLFAVDNEAEAHYLCAIINSSPVREFVKSYSSAGRGFGAPSVMEHLGIPKFDPKIKIHKSVSDMSKKLHDAAKKNAQEKIEELEKENDKLIKSLFFAASDNK